MRETWLVYNTPRGMNVLLEWQHQECVISIQAAGKAAPSLIGTAKSVVVISLLSLCTRRVVYLDVLGGTCVMALALDNGLWYYMTDGQQQASLYANNDPWSNTINVNQQVNANAVSSLFKYPRQPDPWATSTVSTLNTVATVSDFFFHSHCLT